MIFEYCQKALDMAEYKKLDDGTWFADIQGFQGVWANGTTVEEARKELINVLEEWIILKLRDGDHIPEVDGLKVEIIDLEKLATHCSMRYSDKPELLKKTSTKLNPNVAYLHR